MTNYVTPAEAVKILGISKSTITKCKQLGAPVRYIGSCGRHYLLNPNEWIEWMDAQGRHEERPIRQQINIAELRAKRHASVGKGA